jgi:hypothetical protein
MLERVSQEDPQKCLQFAQALFASHCPPEQPVVLPVVDPTKLNDLNKLCDDYGISVSVDP